jgi:hypothetical protein
VSNYTRVSITSKVSKDRSHKVFFSFILFGLSSFHAVSSSLPAFTKLG